MSEQELDFKKVQKMIGRCTPTQLGSLMKQYHDKYFKNVPLMKTARNEMIDFFGSPVDL